LYSAVICKMKRTSKVISIFVDSCKVMTIWKENWKRNRKTLMRLSN
jgi:hypothetical protein